MRLFNLDDVHQFAHNKNWKCLSTEFLGMRRSLSWECEVGHVFEMTPYSATKTNQCPICWEQSKKEKKTYTIDDMQELAKKFDGYCLSTTYINSKSTLQWKCKEGHIFWRLLASVREGNWCPTCKKAEKVVISPVVSTPVNRITIDDMKKLAEMFEGKCLSTEYINSKVKLRWQCKKGDEWEAYPDSVKAGHWCPVCAKSNRLETKKNKGLELIKRIVDEKRGKCLTIDNFQTFESILKWECEFGHAWEMSVNWIKAGYWCPICRGRILTIDDAREIARGKGGECLSTIYTNANSKLRWRCGEGHEWETSLSNIQRGTWCDKCARAIKAKAWSLQIDAAQALASERGGVCLSEKMENSHTVLRWRCAKGHEWDGTIQQARTTWCKDCKKEDRKGKPHPNKKVSIEDARRLAEMHGGACTSVEYKNSDTKLDWKCEFGHEWSTYYYVVKRGSWCPNCHSAPGNSTKKLTIEMMQQLASECNGECLSVEYINSRTNLRWRCEHGHEWEATPISVKKGIWCPVCTKEDQIEKSKRYDLEYANSLASKFGGSCISDKYINERTNLRWSCEAGHEWDARLDAIMKGLWCPRCKQLQLAPDERAPGVNDKNEYMHYLASLKGGTCLSPEYLGSKIPLKWRCEKGHQWEAMLSDIKRGRWCGECGRARTAASRRLSIDHAIQIAKERNGECLSSEYKNNQEKLLLRCQEGHEWEAPLGLIKQGRWCPHCSGNILDMGDMQKRAMRIGCECISAVYLGATTPHEWRCITKGHVFIMKPVEVLSLKGCPRCDSEFTVKRLEEGMVRCQEVAAKRGGRCLSMDYVDTRTKLRWQCTQGHTWDAVPSAIFAGGWCPLCSQLWGFSVSNGILNSIYFTIVTRRVYDAIKDDVKSCASCDLATLTQQLNQKYENNTSKIIHHHLHLQDPTYLLVTSIEFVNLQQLYESFKDRTGNEEPLALVSCLKDILMEVDNKSKAHAIASLIHDMELSMKYIDVFNLVEPIMNDCLSIGKSIFISRGKYEHIVEFVSRFLEEGQGFDTISGRIQKLFGSEFSSIINHLMGNEPHDKIIIMNMDNIHQLDLIESDILPEFKTRFAGRININQNNFKAFISCFNDLKSKLAEIDGKNIDVDAVNYICLKNPYLRRSTLVGYIRSARHPYVIDSFNRSDIEDFAWFLGAIASESTWMNEDRGKSICIGISNPLMFFMHAIPMIRHPSISGKYLALSNAFVDVLLELGLIHADSTRHPIQLRNNNLFLAGLLDTRCDYPGDQPGDEEMARKVALSINIPQKSISEWLSIMPVPLFVDYHPNDKSRVDTAAAYIFGRIFQEPEYTEAESAKQVAYNVKYFVENVFPLCVHPRLEAIYDAARYIDESYGGFVISHRYPKMVREELQRLGGINFTNILTTLNNPIRDPGTGKVFIYCPEWLEKFNSKMGYTKDDIIVSFRLRGEFVDILR